MSPTMIGIYVFVLSCFVGYHVIWGVTPALHTPLMAVTNAISAIVVIGAILVAGKTDLPLSMQLVGFFAVMLASINIFGGFVVTNRMLAMFKKKK
ncbi:MAG TPA: pyridine nucleotide transhydrogenase [Bdellovibrionales bacterium]|nr:MAG: pyridine nucleotide transhydrogenase [Bdellovibrionales bacterium GWB1_52_6]OFZ04102.1 MAG: pyridine nucleotide transhydrogenase [Bdellovibrionales bacterium GWA1_52_35]OFZ36617.1 MAG: pyridine nucleotide transhydrogenase [Bdellovibrionales bacterium GWC1_52_8]HAR42135.1 pyridine nucleotide transhydrogenase [Bdellovibrionales bacterium]HCM39811.1 pyridine nucleotide transhydrogenase [Bdellovibrionales bacterium]